MLALDVFFKADQDDSHRASRARGSYMRSPLHLQGVAVGLLNPGGLKGAWLSEITLIADAFKRHLTRFFRRKAALFAKVVSCEISWAVRQAELAAGAAFAVSQKRRTS